MNAPLCICYTIKLSSTSDRNRASLHSLRTYNTKTAKSNVSKLAEVKDSDFSRRGTIF